MRMGLYLLIDSKILLGLKKFSKQKIIRLGMEAHVLKKENNEDHGFFLT